MGLAVGIATSFLMYMPRADAVTKGDLIGQSPHPIDATIVTPPVPPPRMSYGNGAAVPSRSPLEDVAAIIEADVTSARYIFDDAMGPRTEVTLSHVVVDAGAAPIQDTFAQLGGPLPDGRVVSVADTPVLTPGARYILFLTARPWFYSPIKSSLAFRIEVVSGREIILGPDGQPVLSFGPYGVMLGTTSVIDSPRRHDPLQPLRHVPGLDVSPTEDVLKAIGRDDFVSAAVEGIRTVNAPVGTPSFKPVVRARWDLEATSSGGR